MRVISKFSLAATAAVLLLAPATATAAVDDPPIAPELGTGTLTVERIGLQQITVTAPCQPQEDSQPLPSCIGTLRIYYRLDGGDGRRHLLASVPVDAPVGTPVTLSITTPDVLDILVADLAKHSFPAVHLSAAYAMDVPNIGVVEKDVTAQEVLVSRSFTSVYVCGMPRTATVSAAKAPTQHLRTTIAGKETTDAIELTGTKLDPLYEYRANSATTVKLNGLTYVFAAGTEFHLKCHGIRTGSRVSRFPVAYIERGTVRAFGKPTGTAQVNTAVSTPVGLFSADSRASVDFTVASVRPKKPSGGNLKKTYATLKSKRGTLVARPVFKLAPSASCKPGRSLRMFLDGSSVAL